MPEFRTPPIAPFAIAFDQQTLSFDPPGREAWRAAVADGDPVVYTVTSTPVPEIERELPQSITTIHPGTTGGELWMTKGHQHPDHQGEIYLALTGTGGLLMSDGERTEWLDMLPGTIGYIPPGWAHRSVNTGDEPYAFLAVYPGGAGHDYGWVLAHGMGRRAYRGADGATELRPYDA